ncbi:amidophosphoribosyltransferase [Barnesiella sp. An55]|uniref:amidophosphoribosyltransferase n=1 Tax=Barnesiella sp. An55 TaxID=1965646 RepID=UPI000B3988C8|nr:amidophosphoribosyltransferase [Barnesiella sp. An55]OUN74792.1 amidophosphoribosyltransferase [Barnesiella sp. An55]HIZ26312.1 amidophosphoribosyltransferase [Candidatus Barnesiella merdipullorum]
MTEVIKHECGIAMVRLLKPLSYYQQKYGSYMYGLNKLYLLMEKQHNRGQEGAGLACVKLHARPAEEFIYRERAMGTGAIQEIFANVKTQIQNTPHDTTDAEWAALHLPFAGEVYMGHLRYSTTGRSGLSYVHPFLRRGNWRSRNLLLCGNFNMTNVDEIFGSIVAKGQHPRSYADTFVLLEQLGHALDMENQRLYDIYKNEGLDDIEITEAIENNLNMAEILKKPSRIWDGGYVICGMTGSGDMFSFRDPRGIRPAFYYADDEIVVVASERPVIQTTMNLSVEQVQELQPGECLVVNRRGDLHIEQILPPLNYSACSFERIYFSRGSDVDIYRERKELGRHLAPQILKSIDYDLAHTVFSFIPNTAEVAFYGMLEGLDSYLSEQKLALIRQAGDSLTDEELRRILSLKVRSEKVAIKDIKLRTFIAEGDTRDDLAAHVYDITYGTVTPGVDNLVVIDDSIVRGTTLRQSIIKILDRLHPKKIIIVSSSPQVRFPDCYGIDMSRMGEFIAFKAAMALLKERGMQSVIDEVYRKSKAQQNKPKEEIVNYVKEIYAPFTQDEVSEKIAQMLTSDEITAQVEIIYQTLEGLHQAIPSHPGDWYFSGNYPTPGGNRLVNNAFINFMEGADSKRQQ